MLTESCLPCLRCSLSTVPSSFYSYVSREIPAFTDPHTSYGFCFNSKPWKLEDFYAPTVNFLHVGDPRTWYAIPSDSVDDLYTVCENTFQHDSPRLSCRLPWMDPVTLQNAGVPVNSIEQQVGEIVVIFSKVPYCYFDHGYNCVETVHVGPSSWLPHAYEFQMACAAERTVPPFSLEDVAVQAASEVNVEFDRCVNLQTVLQKVDDREQRQFDALKAAFPGERLLEPSKSQNAEVVCSICNRFCCFMYATCDCDRSRKLCLEHFLEVGDQMSFGFEPRRNAKRQLLLLVSASLLFSGLPIVTDSQTNSAQRHSYLEAPLIARQGQQSCFAARGMDPASQNPPARSSETSATCTPAAS